tara:strand:- start:522 stop:842 length:321 start_codon:yes stop_codon:yes gene_type:complete
MVTKQQTQKQIWNEINYDTPMDNVYRIYLNKKNATDDINYNEYITASICDVWEEKDSPKIMIVDVVDTDTITPENGVTHFGDWKCIEHISFNDVKCVKLMEGTIKI